MLPVSQQDPAVTQTDQAIKGNGRLLFRQLNKARLCIWVSPMKKKTTKKKLRSTRAPFASQLHIEIDTQKAIYMAV
jgi:hypothetical protein